MMCRIVRNAWSYRGRIALCLCLSSCYDARTDSKPELSLFLLDYFPLYSRFVFAVSTTNATLHAYRIDAGSGALNEVSSALVSGAPPLWVATNPIYRAVYVSRNQTPGGISSYRYDNESGALSFANTQLLGPGNDFSHRVFATPAGDAVYFSRVQGATDFYRSMLDAQGIPTGNVLALATGFAGNSQASAISPRGDLVLSADFGVKGIRRLAIDGSGAMSDLGATNLGGAYTVSPISFTPDGNLALAGTDNSQHIAVLRVESDRSLTLLNLFTPGFNVSHGIIDPRGRFYFAISGGNRIVSYRIFSDGTLSAIAELPISNDLQSACVEAGGRFLYLTAYDDGAVAEQIYAFRVSTAGVVSFVASAPLGDLGRSCAASVDRY
ncbi:MAG: lactonase family protein [Leptospirales bacterium]|nr:lactonase family protein [Leptospirales bacterium]